MAATGARGGGERRGKAERTTLPSVRARELRARQCVAVQGVGTELVRECGRAPRRCAPRAARPQRAGALSLMRGRAGRLRRAVVSRKTHATRSGPCRCAAPLCSPSAALSSAADRLATCAGVVQGVASTRSTHAPSENNVARRHRGQRRRRFAAWAMAAQRRPFFFGPDSRGGCKIDFYQTPCLIVSVHSHLTRQLQGAFPTTNAHLSPHSIMAAVSGKPAGDGGVPGSKAAAEPVVSMPFADSARPLPPLAPLACCGRPCTTPLPLRLRFLFAAKTWQLRARARVRGCGCGRAGAGVCAPPSPPSPPLCRRACLPAKTNVAFCRL